MLLSCTLGNNLALINILACYLISNTSAVKCVSQISAQCMFLKKIYVGLLELVSLLHHACIGNVTYI